jgi:hypothetical protein
MKILLSAVAIVIACGALPAASAFAQPAPAGGTYGQRPADQRTPDQRPPDQRTTTAQRPYDQRSTDQRTNGQPRPYDQRQGDQSRQDRGSNDQRGYGGGGRHRHQVCRMRHHHRVCYWR